jgi:hypothetical protein
MSINIPNKDITSDGLQTFTIVLSDYILSPNKDGTSKYDPIDPTKIRVPTNLVNMGLPPTLSAVINKFTPSNVSTRYYATASGNLPNWDGGCAPQILLLKGGFNSDGNNSQISQTTVTTYNSTTAGKAIISTPVLLQTVTNPYVVTNIKTSGSAVGSDPIGKCSFGDDSNGWEQTTVTISIEVTIKTLTYCTTLGNNYVHDSDFCYQYVGDYIHNIGTNSTIDTYMSDLCARTFYQNTTLDVFNEPLKSPMDEKYYQICACNMPEKDYDDMKQSISDTDPDINITNIVPKCLFNPCVSSNFKPANTEGCNAPSCLNIISMQNDNIPNVEIDQTCNIDNSNTNGDPNSDPNGDPDPSKKGDSDNTSNKYGWLWASGILLIIVVIIIIIVVIVVTRNKKKKVNTPKSSNSVTKNVTKK